VKKNRKEREQTDHPAKLEKPVPSSHLPQRGYSERHHQEAKGPGTCRIRDVVDRICAQGIREELVGEQCER